MPLPVTGEVAAPDPSLWFEARPAGSRLTMRATAGANFPHPEEARSAVSKDASTHSQENWMRFMALSLVRAIVFQLAGGSVREFNRSVL